MQTKSDSISVPGETTPLLPPGKFLASTSLCVYDVCLYVSSIVPHCVTGSMLNRDSSSVAASGESDEYEIRKKYELVCSDQLHYYLLHLLIEHRELWLICSIIQVSRQ